MLKTLGAGSSLNQTVTGGTRNSSTFNRSGHNVLSAQGGPRMSSGGNFHHGINRGTVRLGSVKTGRLNYERDHTFYHGPGVIAP